MSCFTKYFEFYPEEDKDLEITLNEYDKESKCSSAFDLTGLTGADITVEVPATPTNLVFTGARVIITSAVKAQIKIELTSAETTMMASGTIKIVVTKGGKKKIFAALGSSKRQILESC